MLGRGPGEISRGRPHQPPNQGDHDRRPPRTGRPAEYPHGPDFLRALRGPVHRLRAAQRLRTERHGHRRGRRAEPRRGLRPGPHRDGPGSGPALRRAVPRPPRGARRGGPAVTHDVSWTAVAVFTAFVALTLGISFAFASRTRSARGYFAAHGQVHWFV